MKLLSSVRLPHPPVAKSPKATLPGCGVAAMKDGGAERQSQQEIRAEPTERRHTASETSLQCPSYQVLYAVPNTSTQNEILQGQQVRSHARLRSRFKKRLSYLSGLSSRALGMAPFASFNEHVNKEDLGGLTLSGRIACGSVRGRLFPEPQRHWRTADR